MRVGRPEQTLPDGVRELLPAHRNRRCFAAYGGLVIAKMHSNLAGYPAAKYCFGHFDNFLDGAVLVPDAEAQAQEDVHPHDRPGVDLVRLAEGKFVQRESQSTAPRNTAWTRAFSVDGVTADVVTTTKGPSIDGA